MPKPDSLISPISIDLGAKNTVVYVAHYPAGVCLPMTGSRNKARSISLKKTITRC